MLSYMQLYRMSFFIESNLIIRWEGVGEGRGGSIGYFGWHLFVPLLKSREKTLVIL